jgi:hypothetical protein
MLLLPLICNGDFEGSEAAEKPFLEERGCTSEANEKMVLELLLRDAFTH